MSPNRRIYLDNAATSWPKPDCVYRATDEYQRNLGAAAGRSAYSAAHQASRLIESARERLADYLSSPRGSDIVFAFNGTDALNLCLFGALRPGDHVITSVVEHNSILRPLHALAEHHGVLVSHVDCDDEGRLEADAISQLIRPNTRMVAVTHASNVTGAIQPMQAIASVTRSRGIWLLVDAAQTVGHVDIDLTSVPLDMMAASGHKGLLGPLGTGFVYLAPGVGPRLRPFRYGGTGGDGTSRSQPEEGVSRFESGNMNVAGLAGLSAAVEYHQSHTQQIRIHEQRLKSLALQRLGEISGLRLVGPSDAASRVGLLSFVVDRFDAHEVANILDSTANIEVRSGMHCAPRVHARLGIEATVRASWGAFTTEEEINTLFDTLAELCATS